jgi:hypothetical protein
MNRSMHRAVQAVRFFGETRERYFSGNGIDQV